MAYNPNQPRASDGEWTGAGGASGATHGAGVNGVGHPVVTKRAIEAIRNAPGGITVSPRGEVPKNGFMVAAQGRTQMLHGHELMGIDAPHIISEFARKNADLLKDPSAHIGVWKDPHSGRVYLDVAHKFGGKFQAIQAGRARNQIAIWDVARHRAINTGGSGT